MDTELKPLQYKLDTFEGPLDMLLQLITKHKLNIYDIEISELLKQYMEQISSMQDNQMEIASEFLEMASRLVYIKSVMLLPKHEEAEELKKELTGQLLEYQECRKAAAMLTENVTYNLFSRQASEIEYDMTYNRKHAPEDICVAYISAVGKGKRRLPPPKEAFSGIVQRKIVSVRSRVTYIMSRLISEREASFDSFFPDGSPKSELVATFLAVLELVKDKRIHINGTADNASVTMLNEVEDNWKPEE